jgi:hypothetical protein
MEIIHFLKLENSLPHVVDANLVIAINHSSLTPKGPRKPKQLFAFFGSKFFINFERYDLTNGME